MIDSEQANFYRKLFKESICDKRTSEYMLDEGTRRHLDAIILPRVARETAMLKSRYLDFDDNYLVTNTLSVVLCNVDLASRAGSQLWVRDVAIRLQELGCRVLAYAPLLGEVANEMVAYGVKVTDQCLDIEDFQPSILHINHWEACKEAVSFASTARTVNMIHGLCPTPGMPGYEGVDQYASASIVSKAKIHALTSQVWENIPIIPNFFDETVYTPQLKTLKSQRALIYSSRTTIEERTKLIELLQGTGLSLDHIGYGGLSVTNAPHQLLPQYDIVFAVGRSAIEACASGANVILWDAGLVGPAITADNFWDVVTVNFALASNTIPWGHIDRPNDKEFICQQIEIASKNQTIEVETLTRNHLSLQSSCIQLLKLYNDIVLGKN